MLKVKKWHEWGHDSDKYPYHFVVIGYRIKFNEEEEQFLQETFTKERKRFGGGGSNTKKEEDIAFYRHIDYFNLPAGKYRFEVKDYSKPIPEYGNMKTSISIHVYTTLH